MNGQSDSSQLVMEIRRNIFNLIFFPIEGGGGCATTTTTTTTTTPTTTAPAAGPKKRPTANLAAAKRRRRRLAAENQAELDDALQNLYKDVVYNH
jgi:hypothetical protein